MDYRISHAHADPPGLTEAFYSEQLVRLPEIAWCYQPSSSPEVKPAPFQEAGHITFASFNHLAKISSEVIGHWARILTSLPDAHLYLLANSTGEKNRRVLDAFAANGVGGDRVEYLERRPRAEYLDL